MVVAVLVDFRFSNYQLSRDNGRQHYKTKQNNIYSLLNEIQWTPSNQSRLVLLNSDAEQLIIERAIGRIVRETY
jgi:hypothetical protein